ncbi:MAG: hypothetical protein AAGK71_11985 [Pseudomonadota bacterium]
MTAINTQPYQAFKLWLADYVPIDRDLLHIAIGAVLLAAALWWTRDRRRALWTGLGLACLAGLGMEVMDIRDSWVAGEVLRWDLSLADLVRTVAVPLMALLVHTLVVMVRKGETE